MYAEATERTFVVVHIGLYTQTQIHIPAVLSDRTAYLLLSFILRLASIVFLWFGVQLQICEDDFMTEAASQGTVCVICFSSFPSLTTQW